MVCDLVGNPEDRFSYVTAHMFELHGMICQFSIRTKLVDSR